MRFIHLGVYVCTLSTYYCPEAFRDQWVYRMCTVKVHSAFTGCWRVCVRSGSGEAARSRVGPVTALRSGAFLSGASYRIAKYVLSVCTRSVGSDNPNSPFMSRPGCLIDPMTMSLPSNDHASNFSPAHVPVPVPNIPPFDVHIEPPLP